MIILIAGGRTYKFTSDDKIYLDEFHKAYHVTGVVNGGAPGADSEGERWAHDLNIPTRQFHADWARHGNAAGPMRNEQMAVFLLQYPQRAVILFPGGKGTINMKKTAQKHSLTIFEPPNKIPC
jgi:hypothetical protein